MRPGWVGALGGLADLDDVRLEAAVRLGALVRDLLGLRQQRLDATQVEQRVAGVALLDDAVDDVALAAGVLGVLGLAVDLAQALGHDLAGGLRGDAAEVVGRDVELGTDGVAVVVELARPHADVEGLGVDGDPRELAGVGHLLVGALERVGQGAHEGLGGNALVGRQGLERFHHLRVATSHDAAFFSGAGRVGRVARAALALPGFGAGSQSNTVRACWMSE